MVEIEKVDICSLTREAYEWELVCTFVRLVATARSRELEKRSDRPDVVRVLFGMESRCSRPKNNKPDTMAGFVRGLGEGKLGMKFLGIPV